MNRMLIDMKAIRIDYDSKAYMITPPFDMHISVERTNFSEQLTQAYLSEGIDFSDFQNADVIKIKAGALELNFKKQIYTYMLRVLDLNINFYDRLEAGYQLFNWNSQDFMKYLHLEKQQVKRFENSPVCKRVVHFNFPSFSVKLNQDSLETGKNQLISELVLSNLDIDFKQFLDYRKHIHMRAQTFFILFKDQTISYISTF
mgnify:CR=1 FL=1